jgi:hypothetical protein
MAETGHDKDKNIGVRLSPLSLCWVITTQLDE